MLHWVSLYNFIMKILFLLLSVYTIYLMKKKRPFCLVNWFIFSHMIILTIILIIRNTFIHVKINKFSRWNIHFIITHWFKTPWINVELFNLAWVYGYIPIITYDCKNKRSRKYNRKIYGWIRSLQIFLYNKLVLYIYI